MATEVRVYQVTDGGPRHGQWCRAWRTELMPAPAFYYYATQAEAEGVVINKCPQCERHKEAKLVGGVWAEMFQWGDCWYSIDRARAILEQLPREPILISRENAVGCGLPIQDGITDDVLRFVNDEHVNHIPAALFEKPGIIAPAIINPYTDLAQASWLLLDGGHRLTALFRAGAPDVLAHPLTIVEALLCQGFSEAQAEAYILANKRAFAHFAPSELELAGLRLRQPGEREGLQLG